MDTIKVLIVDDEPDAIEYVKTILEEVSQLNFDYSTALTGEDGLKQVYEIHPDLIILDVMLPGMDGFKVFYEIRKIEALQTIPIIMLTGVADKTGIRFFKKDMYEYMGSEPFDYIEKPLDPDKLVEAVKKAFEI